MSRRDTIIIAVLINVGLLTILFATARNMEPEVLATQPAREQVSESQEPRHVVAVTTGSSPAANQSAPPSTQRPAQRQRAVRDEVDRVLASYETRQPSSETEVDPMAVTTQSEPESPEFAEVTVKRGDSLDKIARSNNTSVETLVALNSLRSTRLSIGQVLKVPLSERDEASTAATAQPAPVEPKFYVVQSGDNPWTIARRHGIQLEELLRLNDLDEAKARRLRPGDRIRIE